MRARNLYIVLGSFLVLAFWFLSDPDLALVQNLPFGAGAVAMVLYTLRGIILASLLHITRKALLDYPECDFQTLGSQAQREPVGAGLYAIANAVMALAFAIVIAAGVLSD